MQGALARLGWASLCVFIIYESLGEWSAAHPGIWAPTLVVTRDVLANVAVYIAFGALGILSFRDTYRRHWLRLVLRIVGLAILFSASNEALQLYTADRVASLTDIGSAAVGAALGAMTMSMWRPK